MDIIDEAFSEFLGFITGVIVLSGLLLLSIVLMIILPKESLIDSLLLTFFATISVFIALTLAVLIGRKVWLKMQFHQQLKLAKPDTYAYLHVKLTQANTQKEAAIEEFLKGVHRVLPHNTLISLEICSEHRFLHFYIVIPKVCQTIVESQLYAQFPEAEIESVPDYLPQFGPNAVFTELKFKNSSITPFQTYQGSKEDILKNISSFLAKSEANESTYIQLTLRRVGSRVWHRGLAAGYFSLFGRKYASDQKPSPEFAKLSQDVFIGKLRIAYIAQTASLAQARLKVLVGLLKSTKGRHNELKRKIHQPFTNLVAAFKARLFEQGDVWTAAEIATLYHFPYQGTTVSNVVSTTSKRAPAPDILPVEGTVKAQDVSFIGTTNYRNDGRVFGIKREDRRRHLYVVGKTGSGKSRLLELLLISDIQNDKGCCLIDPHGDLADELLMYVPKHRIKDVVYISPSDRDFPIGFNPLEPVKDYEARQHLSRFFIAIFKKLFAGTWNERMEHLIRYITLALLDTPDSSVLGIPRMLSDTTFRQRVIKQIQDPVVKGFWTNEYSTSNEQFINQAAVPIMNKVGQFISNPVIRNMIGQQKNMLPFDTFMNTGKIVIINLSKGRIGDDNAALLGSMFITKIQQAALERASIPEEERRDFYFYVDEFQNFATDAFSSILSEARKYRLDLTIAHQYIAQLPEEVKATAFGNVGSIITFAIGADDAAYLAKEFSPVFTPDDMITLNAREMYVKMSVDGKITRAFSARTLDVPRPGTDYSVEIVNHSRLKYSRNKIQVENEIAQWSSGAEVKISSSSRTEEFPEPII